MIFVFKPVNALAMRNVHAGYIVKYSAILICAYAGLILVGGCFGWSAPVIPILKDPYQTPLPHAITDGQASWVGSIIFIGIIIGPYVSGYVSNKYGRKVAFFIAGIITAVGLLVQATAFNLAMIYAARVISGLGCGMTYIVSLVYLGEIASPNIRGKILTGAGIFLNTGMLAAYSIVPFVSYALGSYIFLIINGVYLITIFLIPESPVFYVIKGREEDARKSLKALGRTDEKDVANVLSTCEKTTSAVSGLKDLFESKSHRRALFITVTINILQQLSGVIPLLSFTTTIFALAGSTVQPHIATIVVGATQVSAGGVAVFLVDKIGRKILLVVSCTLTSLSLAIMGVYFFLDDAGYDMTLVGWLPLAILMFFFLTYDMGFGIIPQSLSSEMFNANARNVGSAITITVAWLCGFATSSAFGYVIPVIGAHYTFWIFAICCFLAVLFTIFFIPETKRKTLVEIQEMLSK